jgi:hypothetical protein
MHLEPIYLGLANARNPGIRLAGKLMRNQPGLVRATARIVPALRQLTDYAGWPRSIISDQPADLSSLREALEVGPYGRCVYRCDNDVVDHQIVLMELENGISVSFTMHGHSGEEGRTIRIDGSQASLFGKFSWNISYIELHQHRGGHIQRIDLPNNIEEGEHGGGDSGLMHAFVKALDGTQQETLTDARSALESHLMAFAAEQARTTNTIIDMAAYRAEAEKKPPEQ